IRRLVRTEVMAQALTETELGVIPGFTIVATRRRSLPVSPETRARALHGPGLRCSQAGCSAIYLARGGIFLYWAPIEIRLGSVALLACSSDRAPKPPKLLTKNLMTCPTWDAPKLVSERQLSWRLAP